MFGCFRRGEANDPEIYTASVASVLAEYPEQVINFVTDPRTGLPSRCNFLPTVKEVRDACEHEMAPRRAEMARAARIRAQLEANREAEVDRSSRPSYEDIQRKFADAGIMIGGRQRVGATEPVEKMIERLGVTREQWDAIPEAKERAER
jgi:hypothetical protein